MKALKNISCLLVLLLLCEDFILAKDKKVSEERQDFISYALQFRGTPYVYGGKNTSGFDCSGFIYYSVINSTKYKLSGSAQSMYDSVEHISENQREPGDLVFFKTTGSDRISHVGIYLGRYTKGGSYHDKYVFVHSASDGKETGVIISSMDEKYWNEHFAGYGRFLPSTASYNSAGR